VLLAACAVLLTGGCRSGPAGLSAPVTPGAGATPVPQARIAVTPATGAVDVRPDLPVTVTATKGRLTEVTVRDGEDRDVGGTLAADGSTWTSTGRLRLGADYSVSAAAVDANGLATREATRFTTLVPKKDLATSISPLTGSTVGVGMPIVVRLTEPVTNRAQVQQGLVVTTSRPVEGAWRWVSDEELHYRPREYWPAGTRVKLDVRLRGLDAGGGVWGDEDRTIRFRVGASMISVVEIAKHRMTIYRNGKVARRVPISTGKAGFLTRNGIKVISEKHRLKVMDASTIGIGRGDPEYYRLDVRYALRVTNSGEFVHAAPWSAGSQGRVNVSHGCVGMSTANAIWLFDHTHVGDVVQVVGSPRTLEPGNGWTDWNVPWETWLAGSAA
jgi:lipoprotein-anchoring transpeptidase ErfK/SrfK